jgi:hypothetical protein
MFYAIPHLILSLPVYTVPAKSLGRSEKLHICLPEIDTGTALKRSVPEKGLYTVLLFGMVFRHYKTKTFHLAAVYLKVNLWNFLSKKRGKKHVWKNLKNNDKRAAVELWRAKVPLSTVRNKLKVFERTLRRVLAFKKAKTLTRSSS